MSWRQLILEADIEQQEIFEDALLESGAQAVSLEDAGDEPLWEPGPGELPRWQRARLTGLYHDDDDPLQIFSRLRLALADTPMPECRFTSLEDKDWQRAWLDHYHPMHFGGRLWICPSHCQPPDPTAVNVILDPGLAFGTGTHQTTAMCLAYLAQTPVQGNQVIDYGCGSGILAVAAARLGAKEVWAVDIDPQALTATLNNAQRNGVADRIHIGKPEDLPDSIKCDLLLANILARPLIALAPRLTALLKVGGALALAGLIDEQESSVHNAYYPHIDLKQRDENERWVLLAGLKVSHNNHDHPLP